MKKQGYALDSQNSGCSPRMLFAQSTKTVRAEGCAKHEGPSTSSGRTDDVALHPASTFSGLNRLHDHTPLGVTGLGHA